MVEGVVAALVAHLCAFGGGGQGVSCAVSGGQRDAVAVARHGFQAGRKCIRLRVSPGGRGCPLQPLRRLQQPGARFGAVAAPDVLGVARHGNGRKDADDGDHDHDLDKGKALVRFMHKLTSLYNRAKLDYILEKEIKYKKRYETSLSLIIADIDFFKNINDTYGHIVGDIILKEFADILSKNIRETDYVGRWGGEEFLFIFPQTKDSDAHIVTENLRKIIEKHNFYNNIKITASFGINECKDENPTKCVSKADKALYEAKNSNRNCVKIFNTQEKV